MTNQLAHAKLSASGSGMWLNCAGSIKAQEGIKDKGSSFAEEGTMAHEIADLCLKQGVDAEAFIGFKLESLNIKLSTFSPDHIITKEMCDYVQEYLDYVLSHQTADSELYTEERVDFSNIVPEGFGTMDSAVLDHTNGILHIFDLKYGKGVLVDAKNNTQAQLYAIGMVNMVGFLSSFDKIRIHIVQPRIGGGFSYWDITVKELNKFAEYVKERAEMALAENPIRTPGEKQCQWCKAKHNCKELAEFTEKTVMASFDEFEEFDGIEEVGNLTVEQQVKIFDATKLIETFLKANKDNLFKRLMDDEQIPGLKLVEGRSNATWLPDAETELVDELGEDAYKKKLIGVTEARKLVGKDKVIELTYKPPGKPTMVHESDKRSACTFAANDSDFNSFDEGSYDE